MQLENTCPKIDSLHTNLFCIEFNYELFIRKQISDFDLNVVSNSYCIYIAFIVHVWVKLCILCNLILNSKL